MSMNTILDAYKQTRKEEVLYNTWGHLAPETNIKYYGYIIVATSQFGNSTYLLDYEFKKLNSSPWLYEDVGNFMFNTKFETDISNIYRFDGWYKKFKNDNCQFGGGKFHKICDATK